MKRDKGKRKTHIRITAKLYRVQCMLNRDIMKGFVYFYGLLLLKSDLFLSEEIK